FDSRQEQQSYDSEAAVGTNGVLAVGAASLPPAPSGVASAPVTPPRDAPPAPSAPLTTPLPPSGPAPLPHTVTTAPEAVTTVPVSWPALTPAAAAEGAGSSMLPASAPPAVMAPMTY
ncbi:hypothetical protein Vafri_21723, partial [Volvox africanus]